MKQKALLLIGALIIVGFAGGWLVQKYIINRHFNYNCTLRLTSHSSIVKIRVTDKKKFTDFGRNYLPCVEGNFVLGDPLTRTKIYGIGLVEFKVTDAPGRYSNYSTPSTNEGGQAGKKLQMTYDFELLPEEHKVIIPLQFEEWYVRDPVFAKHLPYVLAARLDMLAKFDRPEELMGLTVKLHELPYDLNKAGVNYEVIE